MRLLRILLGAFVIAALTATGACWFAGHQFEQAVTRNLAKHQHPDLQIQLISYERGLFRAEAETLWHYQVQGQSLEWRVSHHIQHGPLPAGKLARVDSQLHAQDLPVDLRELFADTSPLTAHSVVFLSGTHQHQLHSPQVSAQRADESLFWGGMQAQLDFGADQRHMQAEFRLPQLRINDIADGELLLEGVNLQVDATYHPGLGFWSGPSDLSMEQLRVREAGEELTLHGLRLHSDIRLEERLIHLYHHWQLESLHLADETLQGLALEFELGRLEAKALAQLLQLGSVQRANNDLGGVLDKLQSLLSQQPYLAVHRLQAQHPQGLLSLDGRVAYQGKGQLLAMNPTRELHAEARLEAPAELLKTLYATRQRESMLELAKLLDWDADSEEFEILVEQTIRVQLNQLVQQGYFIEEAGRWSSEARFEQGRLRINGRAADALLGEMLALLLR